MLTIENFFSSLEGAYAPNTIRSYRSDFEHYATWCHKYQYDPLDIHEDKFSDYMLVVQISFTNQYCIALLNIFPPLAMVNNCSNLL